MNAVAFGKTSGGVSVPLAVNSAGKVLVSLPTDPSFTSLTLTAGGTIPVNGVYLPAANTLEFAANSLAQYRIAPLGVFSWYDGAGGTRMTLNSTALLVGVASANANGGVLQLKSGITFPATQVAATDVNTLDDYEEGTFTPTIVGGTIAGVGTYVVQSGNYTKVGNLVTFRLYVATSAHTGTGAMLISGLPFTSNGTGGQLYSVSITNLGGLTLTALNVAQAYINNGVNYISVAQYATGGGAASAVPICPVPYILVSGSYMV